MGNIKKTRTYDANKVMNDNVTFILESIEKSGYQARIVGGAVRNLIMGENISDIDIATTALPYAISEIFNGYDAHVIDTGSSYGTVTVVYNDQKVEITTLRKDVETFGRKAVISFTDSFEEDSNRRDFTINALYMDKLGNITDYHDAITHCANKQIIFIGDPSKRIKEDYLRIMRYFRFITLYANCQCNSVYLDVINENAEGMKILSSERLYSEMLKIFSSPNSHMVINDMMHVLCTLFAIKSNPFQDVTRHNSNLFHALTSEERIGILLKYGNLEMITKKYQFPNVVSSYVKAKVNTITPNTLYLLKAVPKKLRKFLVYYGVVNAVNLEQISPNEAEKLLDQFLEYISSEYIDFKISHSRMDDIQQASKSATSTTKEIILRAKEIWSENNYVTADESLIAACENANTKNP